MKLPLPVRLAAVFLLFAAFPVLYNNCSELEFGSAEEASLSLPPNGGLTDEEIISRLPPEEQTIIRPISDIVEHPELIEIYKCVTTAKIYICHFPNSEGGENTLCLPLSSIDTHQAHEVQFDSSGAITLLSDYLGPCKPQPAL